METFSYRIVSTEFPNQKIRLNYGILSSISQCFQSNLKTKVFAKNATKIAVFITTKGQFFKQPFFYIPYGISPQKKKWFFLQKALNS